LKISARNVFEGQIENVEVGAVMANIKIKIESPELITAIITKESVEKLDLKKGDTVSAIIKSTGIMVGKD
jgi:molybdopterin-binding protein